MLRCIRQLYIWKAFPFESFIQFINFTLFMPNYHSLLSCFLSNRFKSCLWFFYFSCFYWYALSLYSLRSHYPSNFFPFQFTSDSFYLQECADFIGVYFKHVYLMFSFWQISLHTTYRTIRFFSEPLSHVYPNDVCIRTTWCTDYTYEVFHVCEK